MKIAVATLGNFHANPYGPELQVKQMLGRRSARGGKMNQLIPDTSIRNYVGPFTDKEFYIDLGKKQVELIKTELCIQAHDLIIDVGCGCGRLAIHLLDYLSSGLYFGIDNNHELIKYCVNNIQSKYELFKFIEINVYNKAYASDKEILPVNYKFHFDSNTMDRLICWSVFTHMNLEDCKAYIHEFSRILKKGGTGIISFNLRNEKIDKQIDSGIAKIPIVYWFDEHTRVMNMNQPEDCFAHSEDIICKEIMSSGMKTKKIVYGNWSNEGSSGEFHDYIVFEKIS